MSRRLHALLITAALIVGTWLVVPADAQGRFWVLVNGALRYNGVVQVGGGTAAAPTVSTAGATQSGLYFIGTAPAIANTAVGQMAVFNGTIQIASTTGLGWASGALNTSTDTLLTRVAAGQFGWTAVLFANLGTPANGTFCYCSDCTIAAPCASGGSGAFAKRLNGSWVCN